MITTPVSAPLTPRSYPEVRRLLAELGLRALDAKRYAPVIARINLPAVALDRVKALIGPGWKMRSLRHLAHGRVTFDLAPPERCPAPRPAPRPCEPPPTKVSARGLLAASLALAGSVRAPTPSTIRH